MTFHVTNLSFRSDMKYFWFPISWTTSNILTIQTECHIENFIFELAKNCFQIDKKCDFWNIFELQLIFFIIFLEVYQIQLPIISLFHPLTQKQRYYHRNWISQQIFQQNDQSEINAFCQFSHSILKVCDQNCMLTVGYPKDKILSNKKYKITIVSKVKLIISPQCSSNV